jgi:hypothetical protein
VRPFYVRFTVGWLAGAIAAAAALALVPVPVHAARTVTPFGAADYRLPASSPRDQVAVPLRIRKAEKLTGVAARFGRPGGGAFVVDLAQLRAGRRSRVVDFVGMGDVLKVSGSNCGRNGDWATCRRKSLNWSEGRRYRAVIARGRRVQAGWWWRGEVVDTRTGRRHLIGRMLTADRRLGTRGHRAFAYAIGPRRCRSIAAVDAVAGRPRTAGRTVPFFRTPKGYDCARRVRVTERRNGSVRVRID